MGDWLAGMRTLVVGAGSGIGRSLVDVFIEEGARVAVLEKDQDKGESLSAQLPQVPVVVGDATTYGANAEAVEVAGDAFGGLDVLVSCVGIFDFYTGIEQLDPERIDAAFEETYAVNVKSYVLSVKAALPLLKKSQGNVVLTESTSSYHPARGGLLYVSSKFAVRGVVASLSHELAPQVRVNAVAPGGTLGTDLRGLDSLGLSSQRLDDTPGRAEDLASRVPLNVALSARDHAWSYVFLASDRARGVTGGVVHPDGGVASLGGARSDDATLRR